MLLTVSRLRGEVTALDENALLSTPPPDAGEMPLVTTDVAERSRSHDGFERSQDRDTEFVNGTGNVTEGMCQCQPACPDDESETPDDCPWNRTVVRPDCLCCPVKVCARQAAEACNFNRLPCDEELGLRCDNDTNTCSGNYSR